MTESEKAMAYDEALDKGRIFRDHLLETGDKGIAGEIEYIFPELVESEDERIRKALLRFHASTIDIDGIQGKEILAWIEKQGKSSDHIHYWTEEELDQAAEEYSLGHSVRKECFIDGALWMKEKLKRNDTKD